ncbi:unnamed protein product, partial [Owenia fusiformis]
LKGIRIIVSFVLHTWDFGKMLCKLHELGLYGRHHVLFAYYNPFARLDLIDESIHGCNSSQAWKVLEGTIICSEFLSSIFGIYPGHRHFSTNETYKDLERILKPGIQVAKSLYFSAIYDNIWAIGLAINETLKNFTVDEVKNYKHSTNKKKPLLDSLYKNLLQVDFEGVSGRYFYNKTSGARQKDCYFGIWNSNRTLLEIGFYDTQERNLTMTQPPAVLLKSKGGTAPSDSEKEHVVRRRISKTAIIVLSLFSGVGILIALIYIIYAIVHNKHVMIKDEWPIMTSVVIFGCILLDVYVLVHIADLQTGIEPEPLLKDICMVSAGLLIFGFTFFYGGMAVKLWGVYKLF